MQIAQINDGVITAVQSLQNSPLYAEGRWWDNRDPAVVQEWMTTYGWVEVVNTPKPADTTTDTYDQRSVELIDGIPTEVWTSRPWTAEELASQAAIFEREQTRVTIKAIVTDLKAEKARAQSVIDKTNATITAADTKDVARAAKRIADATIDLARFVKDM